MSRIVRLFLAGLAGAAGVCVALAHALLWADPVNAAVTILATGLVSAMLAPSE